MKITIQTPDFKASQALTDFIEEKVGKLASFSDRVQEGHVYLKLDKSDTKENKICEIKLVIPGDDLFASRQSSSFEDATQQTIEAIRHQLSRWKEVTTQKARGSKSSLDS